MSQSGPIVPRPEGSTQDTDPTQGHPSEQGAPKAPARCARCAGGADPDRVLAVPGSCSCGAVGALYSVAPPTSYPRTITYHAIALTPEGKIGQLLVTRVVSAPGVKVSGSQEWTGVTYRSHREATADLRRLNCGARS